MAKILCLVWEIFAYPKVMEIFFDVFFWKPYRIPLHLDLQAKWYLVYLLSCTVWVKVLFFPHMDVQLTQLRLLKRLSLLNCNFTLS